MKTRHLVSMGMCRVGLEVHFKEAEGCYDDRKAVSRRRKSVVTAGASFVF